MTSMRKRLEDDIARAGKGASDSVLCCYSLSVGETRKVLKLLEAAKVAYAGHGRRVDAAIVLTEDECQEMDAIKAAIAAFEE